MVCQEQWRCSFTKSFNNTIISAEKEHKSQDLKNELSTHLCEGCNLSFDANAMVFVLFIEYVIKYNVYGSRSISNIFKGTVKYHHRLK